MLALLLASPSTALRPNTTLDPCHGNHTTASAFKAWSAKVWRLPNWERGDPPRAVVLAAWSKLNCAAGPGHAKSIRHIWRTDRRAYFAHRHAILKARREQRRNTPYSCAAGRSAIPCSIMECESGGDYGALNASSGAGGRYQVLPSTWDLYGGRGSPHEAPAAEQDRIASEIWADSGEDAWVCE